MSRPPTVLLVEDDDNLRDAYRLVLESRGFELTTAATAAQASERLREATVDTVVADLGLPDLSGLPVIRALREEAPDATLLVLTGEAGEEIRRACREAGADGFLTKPVSGGELAEALAGG